MAVIKVLAEQFDEDYLLETIAVLESISKTKGLKDEELQIIGDLISNALGAIDVLQTVQASNGKTDVKTATTLFFKKLHESTD